MKAINKIFSVAWYRFFDVPRLVRGIQFRSNITGSRGQAAGRRKGFYFLTYLLAILLTGCGFHLRGMLDMPQWLNNITIVVPDTSRDLEPLLSNQLKAYRIQVNPNPSLADYWLIIENDGFQQQVGSISSSTTPRQYQLIYTVWFKLQSAKGKEILPTSQIVLTRQITINSDRILGSTNEEEHSKHELRRDAATQIIERLSRAHEH